MITNPVLKYYGSKFRLARWIIEHFPVHEHYVEPFGGGGSVLFQKPPSPVETYNDLDGEVCNFFRILRERPDELVRAIKLTPWARAEYLTCCEPAEDPLERARRLYFRLWMSRHAGTISTATAFRRNKSRRSPAADVRPQVMYEASKRLASIQIENRDAFKLIGEMDADDTLFYLDPPYVTETRSDKKRYAHELTDELHHLLATVVKKVKGFVILSGYACRMYKQLYELDGWHRIDTETLTNGCTKRTESLWLSPRTAGALA
jgi:DNA adenine methylase